MKADNIGAIAAAGADTFVAGSAIFGAKDYAATIAAMRAEIAKANERLSRRRCEVRPGRDSVAGQALRLTSSSSSSSQSSSSSSSHAAI